MAASGCEGQRSRCSAYVSGTSREVQSGAWSLSGLRREIHGASAGYRRRDRALHAPWACRVAVHVCDPGRYTEGGAMVQEVHLAKPFSGMEANLRKSGEDNKRRLRQSVDRTNQSPGQHIQRGTAWRGVKSSAQKPCSRLDGALILPHRAIDPLPQSAWRHERTRELELANAGKSHTRGEILCINPT